MLIYDIVPPKLKDTPKKKVLKISFWALFIGVIFSFGLAIFLFLQSLCPGPKEKALKKL